VRNVGFSDQLTVCSNQCAVISEKTVGNCYLQPFSSRWSTDTNTC